MGKDMHCVLTYNEKVCLRTIRTTCSFSTIREDGDKSRHILTLLSLLRYVYFFLQIVKKKGIHNSGPSANVAPMKYISINATKTTGFGTIWSNDNRVTTGGHMHSTR